MPEYEHDIATFLTLDGHVFLAPQYNVAFDHDLNEGGSCPDFVVLDLRRREVIVVEVTCAANLKPLFGRIEQRTTRWYGPIRRKVRGVGVEDDSWDTRFLGFVRQANLDKARNASADAVDVTFYAIEDATFMWNYWDKRMAEGLPRRVKVT